MQNINISLEFFPPRIDTGLDKLLSEFDKLKALDPEYVSITFGAGGSTQSGTLEAVKRFSAQGAKVAPHITCIGTSKEYVREVMASYMEHGVSRVVALRGDYPSGMQNKGDFAYASELVRFLRAEFGSELIIEVAAYPEFHPESHSPQKDLQHFKEKIDAGANAAITQYFFNADSYFAFMDDINRLGVSVPVVPGIMPIDNIKGLKKFSAACGAELPRWVLLRLEQYQDDPASLQSFGVDVVSHLCLDLIENGVDALHFYTLNKAPLVQKIVQNISS